MQTYFWVIGGTFDNLIYSLQKYFSHKLIYCHNSESLLLHFRIAYTRLVYQLHRDVLRSICAFFSLCIQPDLKDTEVGQTAN